MSNNLDAIFEKISSIQKDIGYTNQYGFFELIKKHFDSIENQNELSIDAIGSHEGTLKQELSTQLASLHTSLVYCTGSFLPISYPTLIANIAIVFYEELPLSNILLALNSRIENYKKVYLITTHNNPQSDTAAELIAYCKAQGVTTQTFQLLTNDDIATIIKVIDVQKLLHLSKLSTLKPVVDYINQIVKTEHKILTSQKNLLVQDAQFLKKSDSGNFTEINNIVRYTVLKNLQEVEKGIKAKYEEFSKPNYGFFSERIADFCHKIQYSDLSKIEVADKYEKIELGINLSTTEQFFKHNEKELLHEFSKDLSLLETLSQSTFEELNQLLARYKLPKVTIERFVLPDLNPTLIVQGNNYIQKNFRGEITKEGRNEYLIALRDYTGIIMVIVGLLMPLNLLIQGVDFFSDGEQVPKTFAEVNNGYEYLAFFAKKTKLAILLATSILSGILIWYGVVDLRVRIPRKRIEERERETQKAKDHLQAEARRIYNDSYKDWVNSLSGYIREVTQNITFEIDAILKSATKNAQDLNNNKKSQLATSQSIIDNKLKNLQLAERTCEGLQKTISEQKERILI
ncbi:hypothetical protein [Flectobacillus major]|uniref:hypothetical protein n=1 Tax=Flectobacillus major TaxID=103 RepID=UPI00041A8655|nr:hypothetical protein [Flectobacillus major]